MRSTLDMKAIKSENLSTAGTIASSFLAASCCIGPVIFILFGTSAGFLSTLMVLDPFRPYLLGAAAFMLTYLFWKLYVKKEECTCVEDLRARKISRIVFWVAAVFLIISASYLKIFQWISG